MKRLTSLLIAFLLACASAARSESPADVSEVDMSLLDYVSHVYGGPVAGRHYAPLAFVVDPAGHIAALVSGTVDRRDPNGIPPSGRELIAALKQGKTIGFNENDAKLRRQGFLRAFTSARLKVSGIAASDPTIILIRNPDMVGSESGQILNPLDKEWDESLRESFREINASAKLLVIRLTFPNQQTDGSTLMQESGCEGNRCKTSQQQ